MKKVIKIQVLDANDIDSPPMATYAVTFDEKQPYRPWVGGRTDGTGDTYRTGSLDRMFSLLSDEIVRQQF